jgi:hypothetical protein
MTEEEFFMSFAEMFKAIDMSTPMECFLWVGTLIIGGSFLTVAYIALGDAIKSFKRKGSQRAVTPKRKE